MISTILEILVDFGLIHEDYKHRRKISKKEKVDGIKRPFQKYIFQPSTLITLFILAIVILSSFLFFRHQRLVVFPTKTKNEILEISDCLKEWKEKYGTYPIVLTEIINGRPLRSNWLNDAWNKPYLYIVDKNGNLFTLKSAGIDGKFNTSDDIIIN